MVQKKIPMRRCIGCQNMFPKKELTRIVHTPEGEIMKDTGGKLNGRGAYLCSDPECLEKAFKSKALNRAFQMNVDSETVERLKKELS